MYGKASDLTTYAMSGLDTFVFIPRTTDSSVAREQNLSIDVSGDVTDSGSTPVSTFNFVNGRLMKSSSQAAVPSFEITNFAYGSKQHALHSWQAATASSAPKIYNDTPYMRYPSSAIQPTVQVYWGRRKLGKLFTRFRSRE